MVTIHTSFKDTRFERVSFIAPLVAGGLIAGGASLLSGAMSAITGLSSQNKYLKGVRETNETNLQLAREQRAWDLEQWNRENEYNSAAAQMRRWQAAGLSPQSFVGAGSPGEAAALQSPSMANQVAPSDLSGYAGVTAQGIQQGLQGAADAALKWKQMDLNQAQLNIDKQRLANETKGVETEVTYKQALTDQAKANIKFIEAQSKMTDSQRYKFEAETELAWQKWQQLAKLFPLEYESKEVSLAMSKLDKVLSEETLQDRIKSFAIQNGWTVADTKMKLKQAIYWHFQGREGEFQVTTHDLGNANK